MKFIIFLLLVLPEWLLAQSTMVGHLTYQNSGNMPVVGAEVSALWSQLVLSDKDGNFRLLFQGKQAGDEALLRVVKPGFEVVNQKELLHTLEVDQVPLKLYLCPEGEWQRKALDYYKISEEHLLGRYREEIARVKGALAAHADIMTDSLKTLEEQYQRTLTHAQTLSERFAIANLDDASDLYNAAFALFSKGKIEDALTVLGDAELNEHLAQIQQEIQQGRDLIHIGEKKKLVAEEAIAQGIETYILKANLLVIHFRFAEAEENYRKAVEADTNRIDVRFRYAHFLQDQNRYKQAELQYAHCLKQTSDSAQIATVLNNLGMVLVRQNDYSTGISHYEKALSIRERLNEQTPLVYLPSIAKSLQNLGAAWASQNDFSKSIEAFEEALRIRHIFAKENPSKHLSSLSNTLKSLGTVYCKNNKFDQGIAAHQEALRIRRQLAKENPEKYEPELARSLNSLGMIWADQQEIPRSIAYYRDAVTMWRSLAKNNPEAYLPDLAMTLNNLGNILTHSQDFSKGMQAYEEAGEIYETLAELNPVVYLSDLALIQNNIGSEWIKHHDFDQGIPALERALEIRKKLAERNPEVYLSEVAMTYNNIANAWTDLEDYDRGISAYQEALDLYRELAEKAPNVYRSDVALTLNNLGIAWMDQGEFDQGKKVYEETLDTYRQLARQNPSVYEPYVALILNNFGAGLVDHGKYTQGISVYEEAMGYYRELANQYPAIYLKDLARVLTQLGFNLGSIDKYEEGREYLVEGISILDKLAKADNNRHGLELAQIYLALCVNYLDGPQTKHAERTPAIVLALLDQIDSVLAECVDSEEKQGFQTLSEEMREELSQAPSQNPNPIHKLVDRLEKAKTFEEKKLIQSQLIHLIEPIHKAHPSRSDIRNALIQSYSLLSWCHLMTNEFVSAEKAARQGLTIQPENQTNLSNLAHSLLLQGKMKAAKTIYKQTIVPETAERKRKKILLEGLKLLEKQNIIPQNRMDDVEKIRKFLSK